MKEYTLVIPYYRNPQMLRRQLEEIAKYPAGWRVIIVDDGSPDLEAAESIVVEWVNRCPQWRSGYLRLYRIDVDIPWNREGARNLASRECETDWMLHVDIDHVLPAESAAQMMGMNGGRFEPNPAYFYRFNRSRVGQADETRNKDKLPRDAEFGRIHPHIDSYLCTKAAYWEAGGYNEEFSGILGGGSEFLRRLEKYGGRADIAPDPLELHVYTRSAVPDASDLYCSRDMADVRRIERDLRAKGSPKPSSWLRFPWHRVL